MPLLVDAMPLSVDTMPLSVDATPLLVDAMPLQVKKLVCTPQRREERKAQERSRENYWR
jgi:hypothetical protein